MTSCEKYWLKMNGNRIIVLIFTLPVAVLCPELSVFFLGMGLFLCCRSFLAVSGASYHDALRLILSLPFSRKEIFRTYNKGVFYLGGGYILVLAVIRGILLIAGTSYSVGFLHIFTWIDLGKYLLILIIISLVTAVLQNSLLQVFTPNKFGCLLSGFLFLVLPVLYSLYYLRIILRTITDSIIYETAQFTQEMIQLAGKGFYEKMACLLAAAAYIWLLLGVGFLLRLVLIRAKRDFCREGIKC